ncbi:MAG: hypothetical protein ACYC97_13980, partial [Metallibacterium sp.]
LDVAEMADVIATDSSEQAGSYRAPFFLSGSSSEGRLVELAAIISGKMAVRRIGGETTLFCSVGLAGTEVLLASRLFAAAQAC